MHKLWPYMFVVVVILTTSPVPAVVFELETTDEGVTVKLNGDVFTRYLTKSGTKPILWPLIGPGGVPLTRSYPMQEPQAGEATDHKHHRSLWLGHGDVNGHNFWNEENRCGTIEHREFLRVEAGDHPVIVTRNDWVSADGEKQCGDVRTISFGADDDQRWIDFDVTITADAGIPVTFGDTKEGTFALRVPGWMKVGAEAGGEIINSAGAKNAQAWGKSTSWVDYHAPRDGAVLGIAILNHPKSYGFPTYWHVRLYGLFAANPFGLHNFKNSLDEDGSLTLEPGKSFTLSYRVLLHHGDDQDGRVPEAFVEYAKTDKSPPLGGIRSADASSAARNTATPER